jgi:MFS family permease
MARAAKVPLNELRRVVIAASVGNIIEWYDFYIFGSLASILAVKFFEKGHPVAAFLSTVAIFSVGFLIRPLGAFVFGWLGDKVGRKPSSASFPPTPRSGSPRPSSSSAFG